MHIVVVPGELGLKPEHVSCSVLTDDLCVLRVDFSATGAYKNVEENGHFGDQSGVIFRPANNHPKYEKYTENGFHNTEVLLDGWGPMAEKDFSYNFMVSVTHWRNGTTFIVSFCRIVGNVDVEIISGKNED